MLTIVILPWQNQGMGARERNKQDQVANERHMPKFLKITGSFAKCNNLLKNILKPCKRPLMERWRSPHLRNWRNDFGSIWKFSQYCFNSFNYSAPYYYGRQSRLNELLFCWVAWIFENIQVTWYLRTYLLLNAGKYIQGDPKFRPTHPLLGQWRKSLWKVMNAFFKSIQNSFAELWQVGIDFLRLSYSW